MFSELEKNYFENFDFIYLFFSFHREVKKTL